MKKTIFTLCLIGLLPAVFPLGGLASGSDGQTGTNGHCAKTEGDADGRTSTSLSIPDVRVLDQDGRELRFYSDLVKNKVVVINFIFTTCTTICPPLSATFSRIQSLTGERSGRDFHLISVSVDPTTDTPRRLRAWGLKFKARAGWTFVTGSKADIDTLLRALGAYTSQKEDHTPMTIIGNDAKGVWTRAYGLAPPAKLLEAIDDVNAGKIGGMK
jgi:protein SCO1/2